MIQVRICSIYKSQKKEEMYLYVDSQTGLEPVPQNLLNMFGEPRFVMTLQLTQEVKLARADRALVEQSITKQGYYLQMPPSIHGSTKDVSFQ